MIKQHPTACVSAKAQISDNVEIAPHAYIEDNVIIGEGSYIGPNACIYNGAHIGKNVRVFQSASISHQPQDLKYANEPSEVFIDDNTTIHEFVTVHRGTSATMKTVIGKNVLLMAYAHVAHDCRVGDNVILANAVQLGGHVHIDDYTIIGGVSAVHQFTIIGRQAMIGGGCRISQDVPPFILAAGEPLRYEGLNIIGLRRRGFTGTEVETIKKVYNILYSKSHNVSQAKAIIAAEYANDKHANIIMDFLAQSKRGIAGK